MILAELTLPIEAPTDAISPRLGLRPVAITPLGAAALTALVGSYVLQEFTRFVTERRIQRAAEILGVNVGTAEGLLAATAHELAQEAVIFGLGSSLPKSVEAAQIAGQAAALFEMLNPGTIVRVAEGIVLRNLPSGIFSSRLTPHFPKVGCGFKMAPLPKAGSRYSPNLQMANGGWENCPASRPNASNSGWKPIQPKCLACQTTRVRPPSKTQQATSSPRRYRMRQVRTL